MKNIKILLTSILLMVVLSFTGIAYAYTSPYNEPSTLVRYGSTGTSVKWVQDLLKQNGYTITVDGVFGSQTKNAVIHFQKYNNLSTDGIVGELTRNALKKSVGISSTTTTSNSSNNISSSINANMYTTANVNFRSGPSTSNSSYGILSKGTIVYALQSKSNGWTYVKYNNRYGYISSNYLSRSYIAPSSTTNQSNGTLPTFNRGTTNLIDIIKNCKSYYSNNNFKYSLATGVRSIPADKSKSYNSNYYTDCSNFVSWVLYEYALSNGKTSMQNYFSYQRNSATFASIGANGGNDYLTTVNGIANARPGDILVTNGHVEFFSSYFKNSNGTLSIKVYNCGSDASIRQPGLSTSATKYASEIKCILRVK